MYISIHVYTLMPVRVCASTEVKAINANCNWHHTIHVYIYIYHSIISMIEAFYLKGCLQHKLSMIISRCYFGTTNILKACCTE